MGFKWSGGLVFGINIDDCAIYDEEEDITDDGSVIQVFMGLFLFYIVVKG